MKLKLESDPSLPLAEPAKYNCQLAPIDREQSNRIKYNGIVLPRAQISNPRAGIRLKKKGMTSAGL